MSDDRDKRRKAMLSLASYSSSCPSITLQELVSPEQTPGAHVSTRDCVLMSFDSNKISPNTRMSSGVVSSDGVDSLPPRPVSLFVSRATSFSRPSSFPVNVVRHKTMPATLGPELERIKEEKVQSAKDETKPSSAYAHRLDKNRPSIRTKPWESAFSRSQKRLSPGHARIEWGVEVIISPSSLFTSVHQSPVHKSPAYLPSKTSSRARWRKAIWYSIQEAKKRKSIASNRSADEGGAGAQVAALASSSMMNFNNEMEAGPISELNCKSVPFLVICLLSSLSMLYLVFLLELHLLAQPRLSGLPRAKDTATACLVCFGLESAWRALLQGWYRNSFFFFVDTLSLVLLVPQVLRMKVREAPEDFNQYIRLLVIARMWRIAQAGAQLARRIHAASSLKECYWWSEALLCFSCSSKLALDQTLDGGIVRRCFLVVASFISLIWLEIYLFPNTLSNVNSDAAILTNAFVHLAAKNANAKGFEPVLQSFLGKYREMGTPVVFLEVAGVALVKETGSETCKFRRDSRELDIGEGFVIAFDEQQLSMYHVHFRILSSLFIALVLFWSSWSISSYVLLQVVYPLDMIANEVAAIAEEPMKTLRFEFRDHPHLRKVEQGLLCLAKLLQLGFGEAGARVISRCLRNGIVALDTHSPGVIVHAFFGFCDIRNFTDLTEVLQADVVQVVNGVGKIVHDSVSRCHGAPNKNIGDAFLLVWKPKGELDIQEVADGALRSYVEAICEIARDKRIIAQTSKEEVQRRIPGYQLRLGFGLHYGWAIECAIGSQHKVDVSYLSPHVNIASRLEAASKQYGVSILLSGDVFELLSPRVQQLCRMIDRVTVKGSNSPIALYTFDRPFFHSEHGSLPDDIDLAALESEEAFFSVVAPSTSLRFRQEFARALRLYLGGEDGSSRDWKSALIALSMCLEVKPDDGPTRNLMSFIESEMVNPKAEEWKGYRVLDSK